MNKRLEDITDQEARGFVKDGLAKFQPFGYDNEALLVFNKTHNMYHKSAGTEVYRRIGRMPILNKGKK